MAENIKSPCDSGKVIGVRKARIPGQASIVSYTEGKFSPEC